MQTQGTVLKCSTAASTTTFGVTIGKIRNLSRTGVEATDVETHTLDDAPNMTSEPGWINPGEFAITVLYAPDSTTLTVGHHILNSMFKNRVTGTFKLIHPTTTITEEFNAWVKGIGREYPLDGFIAQDYTLRVTGASGLST